MDHVTSIKPRHRAILTHYAAGLGVTEIARMLGVSRYQVCAVVHSPAAKPVIEELGRELDRRVLAEAASRMAKSLQDTIMLRRARPQRTAARW